MSIFFDFEVGATGRRMRRAVDADKDDIELFWNREETYPLYGNVDIGVLIELSCLSICMINKDMDVIGFMALSDHPNIPSVNPAGWEHWIRNMFQKYYVSRNTLFIHFMCCTDEVLGVFMWEAIISVFMNDAYLLHIILVVPSGCPETAFNKHQCFKRHNIFRFNPKRDNETDGWGHYLYACLRKEFVPKLRVRRAVEEDNDDIVAILEKQAPKLKQMYGEFYMSEIIGQRPENKRKVIVIDSLERAAGVMCLNTDVNYNKLQKTYELKSYYGLMKATPLEREQRMRSNVLLANFGEPIMLGQWSVFDRLGKLDSEDSQDESIKESIHNAPGKKSTKVNFRATASMRRSFVSYYKRNEISDDFSEKTLSATPSLNDLFVMNYALDDDPFDFEFVNIDDNWLTVPEVETHMSPKNTAPRASSVIQSRLKHRNSMHQTSIKDEYDLYKGEPNAFIIELFGLADDIDERQAFDMLEVAFEAMKVYDYCLIRVPCHERSFPLLQHFCYVPTRNGICCEYSLYVAHRSSVLNKLRVRRAELIDVPRIAQLLHTLDGKETLWTVENYIFNRRHHNAYVFMSGLSLVGIGILEAPEQINFIRAKFNMAPYHMNKYHYRGHGIDTGFSTLKAVLMYPVFEAHFRHFTREMMRLSGSSNLVWMTAYRNKWVTHKANSLTCVMVPLLPRMFQLERSQNIPELKKLRNLSNKTVSFSTWFIGKKLTSIPKVNVDSRIVVVGASRTAMSFLNSLLFSDTCTYLTFNSVTLVSPDGLPYSRHSKEIAESMFNKFYRHTEKYLKSVPYTYYVNIVMGTMVEINKQQKYISLDNGHKYYYDLLFLLFGKQYQHPNYLKPVMDIEMDYKLGINPPYVRLDVPTKSNMYEKLVDDVVPDNVFILNHISHANKAISYVRMLQATIYDYKIIVYGSTIDAYCCLSTLLDMNIPPSQITFVDPFPSEDPTKPRVPVFSNLYVDASMRKILERKKLNVYCSHYFQSWTLDYASNVVTSIDFISHFKLVKLKCDIFFYYGKRGVNTQAFVAINKSGMAYDGGILIDHKFRTRDPSIYAAGPATRYFMRYWADSKRHKYYDAFEVGEKLGEQIRNQLDPVFTEKKPKKRRSSKLVSFECDSGLKPHVKSTGNSTPDTVRDSDDTLPEFWHPKVTHCRLPGGLQYLGVKPPGMRKPHQYIQALNYNGIVMETFKTGYFKIHLTHDMFVDGITCLCCGKLSLENFKHLYGKPSTVLNNVYLRYFANQIDDFYEFFESPWAMFLFSGETEELFAMVKEVLPKNQRNGETITEVLRKVCEGLTCSISTTDTKLKIYSMFDKTPHVQAITEYVMDWLSETDVILPVYMQPNQKGEYTCDMENNPLFHKKKVNVVSLLKLIL